MGKFIKHTKSFKTLGQINTVLGHYRLYLFNHGDKDFAGKYRKLNGCKQNLALLILRRLET